MCNAATTIHYKRLINAETGGATTHDDISRAIKGGRGPGHRRGPLSDTWGIDRLSSGRRPSLRRFGAISLIDYLDM
jgi:hypothetical protein